MPTIEYHLGGNTWATLEVTYRRRELGGWNVHRADNNRYLAWLTPNSHPDAPTARWEGRTEQAPFRGADVNDTGDVLDLVPDRLFCGEGGGRSGVISRARTRDAATQGLLEHLHRQRATALGFGRHPAVETWEQRRGNRKATPA